VTFSIGFSMDVMVDCTMKPQKLLELILGKLKKKKCINDSARPENYIIKVGGQHEYLCGNHHSLFQFLYIQVKKNYTCNRFYNVNLLGMLDQRIYSCSDN
jgi:hypothetical protein